MVSDNRDDFIDWLRELKACRDAIGWVRTHDRGFGLNRAWACCLQGDWMVWLALHMTISVREIKKAMKNCGEAWYYEATCCCLVDNHPDSIRDSVCHFPRTALADNMRSVTAGKVIGRKQCR